MLKRLFFLILLITSLPQLGRAEPASLPAALPVASGVKDLIPILSPTYETFLHEYFPKIDHTVTMLPYPFKPEAFGLTEFPSLTNFTELDEAHLETYDQLVKKLQNDDDTDTQDSLVKMQRRFLLADVLTLMAIRGPHDWLSTSRIREARRSLARLISIYPSSPYTIRASYHLAIILLEQKDYEEFFALTNRQLARWGGNPEWGDSFRSVLMEAYYRRGQMGRAEGFLWQQAFNITGSEVSRDLSLRYADALFWERKFDEVTQWYGKMAEVLEPPDSEAAQVSRFYYAEALFQTGQCDEAVRQFNVFLATYTGTRTFPEIRLREIECEVVKTKDYPQAIAKLEGLILKPTSLQTPWRRMTGMAAEMAASRLALFTENQASMQSMIVKFNKRLELDISPWLRKEMLYTLSMLQWATDQKAEALASLITLSKDEDIMKGKSRWNPWISKAASFFLAQEGERYVTHHHAMDYIRLVDDLNDFIEDAPQKNDILLWTAKAYLDRELPLSAVRLLQKVFFEEELTPEYQSLYALQLARGYGSLKEMGFMDSALKLIDKKDLSPEDQQLYYLTKAQLDGLKNSYASCTEDYKEAFKYPITASKILTFSLNGAICARKAKKVEDAENFITHFGEVGAILAGRLKTPSSLWDIQVEGLFEKINILVAKEDFVGATQLFEKISKALPDTKPPLETIFLIVDAYRKKQDPDLALRAWQNYQQVYGDLPEGFVGRYTDSIETLARAELLPH